MRRREFLGALGAAAATTWPHHLWAQTARISRIAVLMNLAADDVEAQTRNAALLQGLQKAGWVVGQNLRVDYRWVPDARRLQAAAAELVALEPAVIVANAPPSVTALQQASQTVPIVFTAVTDPVALGLVQSMSNPGGNATGFASAEFGLSAKWLELLKAIAPHVRRVAVVQDPGNSGGTPQFAAIQSVAPSLNVTLSSIFLRTASELEKSIAAFAREPDSGMIVTRTSGAIIHRDSIIRLAARHRLPTVYPLRFFATDGGLSAYGPDIVDQYRRAASYVDRILKGEKAGDLPVQSSDKYEIVINLKTAKSIGIEVPLTLLTRADEVIE